VLSDAEIDLVMICTRHKLHGALVLQALRAGKHVLVEKPLCINSIELDEIKEFFAESGDKPVLMTAFNRRFAPVVRLAHQWLKERHTPLMINYRMNAGYVPLDHWVHGEEGGGRNIGEACHIYDLFNFLVGSEVTAVHAASISPPSRKWLRSDNFVATLNYRDGSVCALTYTALGANSYPKERMEIYGDGKAIVVDDFKSIDIFGAKVNGSKSPMVQKGHLEELEHLADCLQNGTGWPIPLDQQVAATEISFLVQEQIQ